MENGMSESMGERKSLDSDPLLGICNPISRWCYRQLISFFDPSKKYQGEYKEEIRLSGDDLGSDSLKGCFRFLDLNWKIGPYQDESVVSLELLENRAILFSHLLSPWSQEESLLKLFVYHLKLLCKEYVLGSPDILISQENCHMLYGGVFYLVLVPKPTHNVFDSHEFLLSMSKALASHAPLTEFIISSTLLEGTKALKDPSCTSPKLSFRIKLMNQLPVTVIVDRDLAKHPRNGLTEESRHLPELWISTYKPYFYHMVQIVIYWTNTNNLLEYNTICNTGNEVGFSLFSILNMALCVFLRCSKNPSNDISLIYLLFEFFTFWSTFRSSCVALYLGNHSQNYVCKRIIKNKSHGGTDPVNDPFRIQILNSISINDDLTSNVTLSKKFITAARKTCKHITAYLLKGVIDDSSTLLDSILNANDLMQERRLSVALNNKIFKNFREK